jgi:hypothetical protein
VEKFTFSPAVLPMKLFTVFHSDDRAVEHVLERSDEIDAILDRVMYHDEWGIRLVVDRARATSALAPAATRAASPGARYLAGKKARRDAAGQLAVRARAVAGDVHDRLAALASAARRRSASDSPAPGAPLLLDAAFLVPRPRARRFRAAAARKRRALEPRGYRLTMTGPWPPYSFLSASARGE